MPGDWSRLEVEATVADYFDMFESELRGESYVKAAHNRRLRTLLDDRSTGACRLLPSQYRARVR